MVKKHDKECLCIDCISVYSGKNPVFKKLFSSIKRLNSLGSCQAAFTFPRGYQKMFKKFQKIEHKCYLLSKDSIHSKSEIVNMVIEQVKTTTMDFEQAFYFISGRLSK